jgi:hypothetical protein
MNVRHFFYVSRAPLIARAGGACIPSRKTEIKAERVFGASRTEAKLVQHPSHKPAPLATLLTANVARSHHETPHAIQYFPVALGSPKQQHCLFPSHVMYAHGGR